MRYRKFVVTATAAGLGAAGLVAAAPAVAERSVTCSGVASNLDIQGDLVVPAGESCELTDVRVDGDAVVRAAADLILTDSRIDGDVVVRTNAYVDAVRTRIDDEVRLRDAYGLHAEFSRFGQEVEATGVGPDGSSFVVSIASEHNDDLVTRHGVETYLESGWVTRDVRTRASRYTDLQDTVVEGDVRVSNAAAGAFLCASEVDGDAAYTGNAELLWIGLADPSNVCDSNVIGDDVRLAGNTGDLEVSGNIIRGNLACQDNDPAPVGADNRVRGRQLGQCDTLAPAGTSLMGAQSVEDRRETTLDRAATRVAAAERAAAAAGPALGG